MVLWVGQSKDFMQFQLQFPLMLSHNITQHFLPDIYFADKTHGLSLLLVVLCGFKYQLAGQYAHCHQLLDKSV